jgi:hypothetical protein
VKGMTAVGIDTHTGSLGQNHGQPLGASALNSSSHSDRRLPRASIRASVLRGPEAPVQPLPPALK